MLNFKIGNPFQKKYIAMFGFALFCVSFMFRSIIIALSSVKVMYLIYIVVLSCMTIAITDGDMIKIEGKLVRIFAAWGVFVFIFVLLHNQLFVNKDYGTTVVWLYYFSMIILLPMCPQKWYRKFFYIMLGLIIIDVVAVYFFMIFKSKYSVMYNILQEWPTGTEKGNAGYRAGLTSHYSHNAMLIVVGLIAFSSEFIISRENTIRKQNKFRNIAFLILTSVALILTTKRAHFLFGFIAIFFGYIIYNPKKRKKNVLKAGLIAVILLIVFVLLAQYVPFVGALYERFSTAGEDSESMSRFAFWRLAFSSFLKSPLIGIGWGGYQYEYHEHLYVPNPYGVDYPYLQTHNVYIQLLCECGIIGTALFLYCAGHVFVNIITIFRKNPLIKYFEYYDIAVCSLILQTFFFLYCLTGNCLYDMMFAFYAIAAGLSIGLCSQNKIGRNIY